LGENKKPMNVYWDGAVAMYKYKKMEDLENKSIEELEDLKSIYNFRAKRYQYMDEPYFEENELAKVELINNEIKRRNEAN
jgi:hypothetical protein